MSGRRRLEWWEVVALPYGHPVMLRLPCGLFRVHMGLRCGNKRICSYLTYFSTDITPDSEVLTE
jgi:hypothetical protein